MTGKVLVLGRDDRAFLGVIRSLGRHGVEVHLAWCPPDAVARHSRYVTAVHELPPYSSVDDAWKRAFIRLCQQERFDLVVPTNDPTIIPLQTHRADLEPHARIYLVDAELFPIVFDKDRTYELARSLDIDQPRQLHVSLPADPATILGELPLPVVLKPRASFRLQSIARKAVVRKAFTPDELVRGLSAYAADGEVWVQEYCEGHGVGVEGIADRGEVLMALQHVRVHERSQGGADSYRKTVALDPVLHAAFQRMMAALRYTGVAMLEFKVNPATGRSVLLDVNARFWGSLPLALAAGADVPWYLYRLLVEGRHDVPRAYRVGTYARNWNGDLLWLSENRRRPAGERVGILELLAELGPMLTLREHADTLVLDDPRPGLVDAGRLFRRAGAKLARVAVGRFGALAPVRSWRTARARRALGRAQSILFVCKGNICRSPFAEAYARTALGDAVQVSSAGYYPKQGRPCPPEAIAAAREVGVDLDRHRSTVVTEDLIRRAGVIFVLDRENYDTLVDRFGFARTKIHRLGYLAGNGVPDIRDPYGRSLEDFRKTYRRIVKTLEPSNR